MIESFWPIFIARWRSIFLAVDFAVSIGFGLATYFLLDCDTIRSRYVDILTLDASLIVGLLGLVLAGLALVISFMNDDLLAIAHSTGRGILEDFFPFSFTAALCVLTTIVSLAFLTFGDEDLTVMRVGLAVSNALFVWSLLSIASLVRFAAGVGVNRANLARSKDEEDT